MNKYILLLLSFIGFIITTSAMAYIAINDNELNELINKVGEAQKSWDKLCEKYGVFRKDSGSVCEKNLITAAYAKIACEDYKDFASSKCNNKASHKLSGANAPSIVNKIIYKAMRIPDDTKGRILCKMLRIQDYKGNCPELGTIHY
jgi:hypothetical protein